MEWKLDIILPLPESVALFETGAPGWFLTVIQVEPMRDSWQRDAYVFFFVELACTLLCYFVEAHTPWCACKMEAGTYFSLLYESRAKVCVGYHRFHISLWVWIYLSSTLKMVLCILWENATKTSVAKQQWIMFIRFRCCYLTRNGIGILFSYYAKIWDMKDLENDHCVWRSAVPLPLFLSVGKSSSAPIFMSALDERLFVILFSASTSTMKVPQTGRWSENLDSPR